MAKEITTTKIAIFRKKEIRKTIYKNEWWFVITDVIEALTDSTNSKQYLKNMLNRDEELVKGWVQIEHPLLIDTRGGKQMIKCAGWQKLAMNEYRKLKIQNSLQSVHEHYTKQKGIQMRGLKKGCEALKFVKH